MWRHGWNSAHELQVEGEGLNLDPQGQMFLGSHLAPDEEVPSSFMGMVHRQFFTWGEGIWDRRCRPADNPKARTTGLGASEGSGAWSPGAALPSSATRDRHATSQGLSRLTCKNSKVGLDSCLGPSGSGSLCHCPPRCL